MVRVAVSKRREAMSRGRGRVRESERARDCEVEREGGD